MGPAMFATTEISHAAAQVDEWAPGSVQPD